MLRRALLPLLAPFVLTPAAQAADLPERLEGIMPGMTLAEAVAPPLMRDFPSPVATPSSPSAPMDGHC